MVRTERFRSGVALGTAVLLHVVVLVFVRRPLATPVPPALLEPSIVWLEEPSGAELGGQKTPRSSITATPGGASERALALHRSGRAGRPTGDTPLAPDGAGELDAPPGEPAAGSADDSERLSLDALGIGKNPFLEDAARTISKKPNPARGIRQSLTDAIAKSDQRRGLGPEGPVLARLIEETRRSDAPGNSSALFRATTDARGHLIGFELVEASGGEREFRALAARVLAGLREVKLRIPRGVRGVTMDVRVVSHVELPSGRDPGLGVDVLGIPLKKPGGETSPRVSILRIDPKGYKVELPNGKTVTLPSVPLPSLGEVAGDPTDIGAKAQRMVRAHLERIFAEDGSVPETSF